MKTSIKALLIGLLAATCAPALASTPTTTKTTSTAPIKFLEADVSTLGKGSFSGLGTASFSNQTGTSQNLNVGLSSSLSATTSVESSKTYASSGQATALLKQGGFNQTFGVTDSLVDDVTSTAATGGTPATTNTTKTAASQINGSFKGSFDTNSDAARGSAKSDVELAGVSSTADLSLDGSSIDVASAARVPGTDATENGLGSAVGNITTSTNSAASISSSSFTSGFIQSFSPGTGVAAGVADMTIVEQLPSQ